jgi:hypothetical protein
MRATVRNLILGNSAVLAVIPASRWYAAGSVIDNPLKPFGVLRWLAPVPSNAIGRFARQLRVDVHDERGSYARIRQVLGSPYLNTGLYGTFSAVQNVTGSDGRVAQMDYLGESGDQEDPTYMTNYMFSSWQVIGVDL